MGDILDTRRIEAQQARAAAVVGLLLDWAEWQQSYRIRLGYPQKSVGLSSGGSVSDTSGDDYSAVDDARCEIVDKCIDDLPSPAHRAAIHHRYLSAVFRMRDYERSLEEAHDRLLVAFRVKGCMW